MIVTKDGNAALRASKLVNLLDVLAKDDRAWAGRNSYKKGVMYVFSVPTKKSHADVISFYSRQVKELRRKTLPATTIAINGTCHDGKSKLEVLYNHSSNGFLQKLTPGPR